MEYFFTYLLKSAGVLAIFVISYWVLLRRLTFFRANRFFLLFGMLASLILPFIEITQVVYVEEPPVALTADQLITMMALQDQSSVPSVFDFTQFIFMLYLAVSLFFLGKMVVELLSLKRLIATGSHFVEHGFTRVSLTRKVTPFSFFHYICFTEGAEQRADYDLILKHEQVHAREWHSLDLLFSHMYRAVFWINPLAWLLKRQIGENLEFIADASAKIENATGISYERALLSSAASHMQPALTNNFFTPFIKKRIHMLQQTTSNKWNAYKYALILPMIVLFLYSFNTVTKTEYITSNTPLPFASELSESPVILKIDHQTEQSDLNAMAELASDYANYSIAFKKVINKEGDTFLEVLTSFNEEPFHKNLSVLWEDESVFSVEIYKDNGVVRTDGESTYFKVADKNTVLHQPSTVMRQPVDTVKKGSIYIKFPPSTTRKSIEESAANLKEEYNVDLRIKRLKYKGDRIVRLSLDLDDNQGSQVSYAVSNNKGIKTVCINGTFNENFSQWEIMTCDASSDPTSITFTEPLKFRIDSLSLKIDSMTVKVLKNKTDRWARETYDSLYIDKISERGAYKGDYDYVAIRKMHDSARRRYESRYLKFDTLRTGFIKNRDAMRGYLDSLRLIKGRGYITVDSIISKKDQDIWAYQSKSESDSFIFYDGAQPLFIIDGKEVGQEELNTLNPNEIASINVLKDKAATRIYGDKGNRGVIVVTTKRPDNTASSRTISFDSKGKESPLYYVNGKKVEQSAFEKIKTEEAINKYGKEAKNGVLAIQLKTLQEMNKNILSSNRAAPYIIIDGKVAQQEQMDAIGADSIESVTVLKGDKATALYGEDAKDGAIIIVTKQMKKEIKGKINNGN